MSDISPTTRERVKAYATKIGYQPNQAARSLATARSHTIALGMGAFANPFFQEMTFAILREARMRSLSLMLIEVRFNEATQQLEFDSRQNGALDGLVLLDGWYEQSVRAEHILHLERTVAPTLFRGNVISPQVDQILVDWEAAAYDLTTYVLTLGHRHIGILRGVGAADVGRSSSRCQKTLGSQRACERFGVPWESVAIRVFSSHYSNAKTAAIELLLQDPRPTVLICHTDYLAVGAMRAAEELGLRVPQDVSVAGFNDIELGSYLPVALTTIGQSKPASAAEVVERILSRVETGRPVEQYKSRIKHELIIRESCQAPAGYRKAANAI